MSKKFIIGASIALAVILAGGAGFYFWNRASADVISQDFCSGITGRGWTNCNRNFAVLRAEMARIPDPKRFKQTLQNADKLRNFKDNSNPMAPTSQTLKVLDITETAANFQGNITNVGGDMVNTRGFQFNTTDSVVGSTYIFEKDTTGKGFGKGLYVGSIATLTTDGGTTHAAALKTATNYYVRSVIGSNTYGVGLGEWTVFKTLGTAATPTGTTTTSPVNAPVVTTQTVSALNATSATFNGTIVSNPGAAIVKRGFAFDTKTFGATSLGWIIDYTPAATTVFPSAFTLASPDGTTGGSITLKPGTTYFIQAFADNDKGRGYGNMMQFTTPAGATPVTKPVVVTKDVTNILAPVGGGVSATFNAEITSLNGKVVKTRSFQISKDNTLAESASAPGYIVNTSTDAAGFPAEVYSNPSTGLNANYKLVRGDTYYVRAKITTTDNVSSVGAWKQFVPISI